MATCAIRGLAVQQMDPCEIIKSALMCHNPVHLKHKTLSLNDLFALN